MTPAILLAGAHAWKEEPFDALCPRALLPLANRPLVGHVLAWLRSYGVHSVIICVNDRAVQLEATLREGAQYDTDVHYLEDRVPRGPAGCARDATTLVRADTYLVVECGVAPQLDLHALLAFHRERDAAATVVTVRPPPERGPGVHESSPAGVFVFSRAALESVPAAGFRDLKEMLIPDLVRRGAAVVAYVADHVGPRVTSMESYLQAQAWMLGVYSADGAVPEGYERRNCAWLHPSAAVAERARIIGPVMLGPESRVEDEALVIGPAVIGAGGFVGRRAVVGRSVLWEGALIGDQAIVDQCVVPTGAAVGAGESRSATICLGGATR
ncbi:MAG: NDP-sugar synthase [Planctomycetota bacterium]